MSSLWLVIHPEEELCELLRARAPEADIASSITVGAGLNACCALEPSIVVVSTKLSDKDAHWIIGAIRGQVAIAHVPILVLSSGDEPARLRLLKAGADVVLAAPPISTAGIVASVQALLALCERMRDVTLSSRPVPSPKRATGRVLKADSIPPAPIDPPTTRRPVGGKPTLRTAGFASLKPLLGPPTPMGGMKPVRRETLHSQPSVGPESTRARVGPIPVEAPKEPWVPPKKSGAADGSSAKATIKPDQPEPSTRRPR